MYIYISQGRPDGPADEGPGGPTRARPVRVPRRPQGLGPQGPRGAHKGLAHRGPGQPKRARPRTQGAHKRPFYNFPELTTRVRPMRAQQGLAQKGPGGPTRAWPMKGPGGTPLGPGPQGPTRAHYGQAHNGPGGSELLVRPQPSPSHPSRPRSKLIQKYISRTVGQHICIYIYMFMYVHPDTSANISAYIYFCFFIRRHFCICIYIYLQIYLPIR